MADNYLITGYWGEPHVTAENDRGINAAMFGTGRFVLPVGEQFKAEYIGNNTIRMYDGKLMNNGAAAGIPVGEYVDLLIANAGQGMKRNDLIAFQYSQDASTLIESGKFVVIKGEETNGTASDPTLTQGDLLSNKATFDQMALWRVSVSGATISAPVKLFSVATPNGIEDPDYPGCYYRMNGSTKEWVNPPMVTGKEYRTTERYLGKPVYAKVITGVALAVADTTVSIPLGVTAVTNLVDFVITHQGTTDSVYTFPSHSLYDGDPMLTGYFAKSSRTFVLQTHGDFSAHTATVFAKYTKD